MVTTATLALLVIQAFQTRQLYDRKSSEFSERFSTTLDRIALHHEKAEDFRRYMQIIDKDFSGKYKDILKEEFRNLISANESISIKDTSFWQNGKIENFLIIQGQTYDSISGLTAEQRVLARDVRKLRDLFVKNQSKTVNKDSLQLAVQLDQRVIQQIFKKARFVNELMVAAFRNNVYQDPSERLDIFFLDSVIKTEIELEDLPNEFEFVITNELNEPVKFMNSPPRYNVELDTTTTHKSLLFPSNPLDEDLFLHLRFPTQKSFLLQEMWLPLMINLALVLFIFVALTFMFKTILTQKKLSEMRNDFISNMTHEFKTPISTISLACEAMSDSDMVKDAETDYQPFIKIIHDENQRLSTLVERILQSAIIDRGELNLNMESLNLNEMLKDLVQNAQFRISGSEGEIYLELPEEIIEVNGDRLHVRNAISNLIDNAIKYSRENPVIHIRLKRIHGKIHLSVADKGIGIKKEYIAKIFDKLYRIPTGNLHDVKGFGLGLNYVKAIAQMHGWNVHVKSKYREGSEFTLIINEA